MTPHYYVVIELPWTSYLEFNAGLPPTRHADMKEATRFPDHRSAAIAAKANEVPRFEILPMVFIVDQ